MMLILMAKHNAIVPWWIHGPWKGWCLGEGGIDWVEWIEWRKIEKSWMKGVDGKRVTKVTTFRKIKNGWNDNKKKRFYEAYAFILSPCQLSIQFFLPTFLEFDIFLLAVDLYLKQ